MPSRLSLALETGSVALPDAGDILVFRPDADFDFGGVPGDRLHVVEVHAPTFERLRRRGYSVSTTPPQVPCAAAIVCVTKSKAETLDLLSQACAHVPEGAPIIVDGAKSEGIESILKIVRKAVGAGPVFSKAHGKTFPFAAPARVPEGWAAQPMRVGPYLTRAGVFSADGIDPGSRALVEALPALKGRVCDLGAGWGYLSAEALARSPDIEALDLVEADWTALSCARENVTDPRAAFHWADATAWEGRYDTVLSNPPFHAGRRTAPELGQAFIARAARLLAPRGQFLMVANRHLPYEATLKAAFSESVVLSETGGYKVISAKRPVKG